MKIYKVPLWWRAHLLNNVRCKKNLLICPFLKAPSELLNFYILCFQVSHNSHICKDIVSRNCTALRIFCFNSSARNGIGYKSSL